MSANFKPWLLLGIIFIVGIVTGSALTIGMASHFMHPPGEQQMKVHWMARLTRDLKLTGDQQAKIQPILADATTKIQALHRDEVNSGSQIFKAANDQISALLTPEQKVELQKIESDREKKFSDHMHSHEGPGGPSHDSPGGMHHHGGLGDDAMPPPGAQTNAAPPGPSPQNP